MAKPVFEAMQAEDGTWMVVDSTAGLQVEIDGMPQIGMDAQDAYDLAAALNGIQGNSADDEV